MDSGEEISHVAFAGLGPGGILGSFTHSAKPFDVPKFLAAKGEGHTYDVKRGWQLLAGIVAWGRVNHDSYFQLFWIPIPTGSSK
jgi:hypothetical protein